MSETLEHGMAARASRTSRRPPTRCWGISRSRRNGTGPRISPPRSGTGSGPRPGRSRVSRRELGKAGDYITTTLGAEVILCVRGEDGVNRAFYNVCQHRGMQLMDAEHGHTKPSRLPLPRLDLRSGRRAARRAGRGRLHQRQPVRQGQPCGYPVRNLGRLRVVQHGSGLRFAALLPASHRRPDRHLPDGRHGAYSLGDAGGRLQLEAGPGQFQRVLSRAIRPSPDQVRDGVRLRQQPVRPLSERPLPHADAGRDADQDAAGRRGRDAGLSGKRTEVLGSRPRPVPRRQDQRHPPRDATPEAAC